MKRFLATTSLLITLVLSACASAPGSSASAGFNPYVCNDNEPNDHLAQLSLCRGGGLAPPQ